MNEGKMASYCSDSSFFRLLLEGEEKKGNSALAIASFFFNKHRRTHNSIKRTIHTFIILENVHSLK